MDQFTPNKTVRIYLAERVDKGVNSEKFDRFIYSPILVKIEGVMTYKVFITKELNKSLRELLKAGKHGKQANIRVKAAQAEASLDGEITTLSRTHHGESRLPNIEKYDLGEGYRLIVQLIDGMKSRAFLFVGCHEDADEWLDSHRNYKWLRRESDGTLDFVQCQERSEMTGIVFPDLTSEEASLELPLLRSVSQMVTTVASEIVGLAEYILSISSSRFEEDPSGVFDNIIDICMHNEELAICMYDILELAHKKEFNKIDLRILAYRGKGHAQVLQNVEISNSMQNPINSESFVEYEEISDFFKENSEADWADWMLFLHPTQKEYSKKNFAGPARLRGVSGSGKTCVLVHRARHLAKKYNKPILVLTLTESMRRLLDNLLDKLCGIERNQIKTYTVSGFAKNIIDSLHEKSSRWYTNANPKILGGLLDGCCEYIFNTPPFQREFWIQKSGFEKKMFIERELSYIRSRLTPDKYEQYLQSSFKRVGREIALADDARMVIYTALTSIYEKGLSVHHILDHEGIVQAALPLLANCNNLDYQSILVDEVQDLSQNEMFMISQVKTDSGKLLSNEENGLFLVGDGAQTIYKKGFSLKQAGISISGRSFTFKKNYRNTKQILRSAFSLISSFEYADVDEDNIQKPTDPELAIREGEQPKIVKTYSIEDECEYVAEVISDRLHNDRCAPGGICVIGLNQQYRKAISQCLLDNRINACELKDDVVSNDIVKISTIESAKGHEFELVFIIGLSDGVMPKFSENISFEASRLYVGMTRACNELYMTYTMNENSKPSPLLGYIHGFCDEFKYENGVLTAIE